MTYRYMTAIPLILALSTPAAADMTLGLGLTFTWGGASQGDTGVGLRVFSDDEKKEFVGSLGVDYLFGAQTIRPNAGIAYLAGQSYVGMDVGFGIDGSGANVGVGLGLADTE